MKTLFVSDLDGTLITKEEKVSAYSCDRINRLIQKGMLFTYATARSLSSAQRAVKGLSVPVPAILYNGGLIYDERNDAVLHRTGFSEEGRREVLDFLHGFGIFPFVFSEMDRRERVSWRKGSETEGMLRYLSRRTEDPRMNPAFSDEALLSGFIYYFKCVGPRDLLESAWNILKYDERFLCIFHQETYQSDFWMEISPRNASKATGVEFLKEYLSCDRVVCFGDTSNDSDMFDVCDEKYAVMNADDWLKAKATGVIGYCEEDGVAKWLEEHSGF